MATIIYNATQLQAMSGDLTADYELGSDIDASDTVNWNGGLGFDPIGSAPSPGGFSGSFDGKGYKIINLTINRPLEDEVGLFGYTEVTCGAIKNVGLENCDITGEGDVGSLIGFHEYMTSIADGVVSNCWTTGIVKGEDVLIGGLLGYNGALAEDCWTSCDVVITGNVVNVRQNGGFVGLNDRVIRRSYATGDITCEHANVGSDIREIGGFCGYSNNEDIDECFSTGNVVINNDGVALDDIWAIGGFIGDNWGNGIRNCYSRGSVTVTAGTGTAQAVGGLIGYNEAECVNSYSTGLVTAPGFTRVGGLVGYNETVGAFPGTVTDSFWDTETSGQSASEGGTGKTTEEMKDVATFQAAEWAISRIWNVFYGCNEGYPCLIGVNLCCPQQQVVDRTIVGNKVSLEAIRNLEIVYGGRFYMSKSGDATYESRYHRNV